MHFGSLFDDSNTKDEQGDWGEFRVKNKILRIKDKLGDCYLYNDVYIEIKNHIYQIDHILITCNGIFVIETKAVSGKIIANPLNKEWSSYVYGKHTTFINPIYQNKLHIDALKYVFGVGFDYHSIIVLTERNLPSGLPSNVINLRDLQDYLLSFNSEHKLTSAEMNYFKTNLDDIEKQKIEFKKKHKEKLKYHNTI